MSKALQDVTVQFDIWASAIKNKSAAGRGTSKKAELYGVKKLRQLILELAVRGVLVPQDPNDEPASKSIESFYKNPANVKTHQIDKMVGNMNSPPGLVAWAALRLDQIGSWAIGSGFPVAAQGNTGGDFLFSKVSDMNLLGNEKYLQSTVNTVTQSIVDKLRLKVHPPGTVIFPKIGGAIATNKRRILVSPTIIDNNCLGITPYPFVATDYLFQLLSAMDFTKYQAGTSVPALSQNIVGSIIVILPPTSEQHRIVAKVDELMSLCDKLEQQQEDSIKAHETLVSTLLSALTNACKKGEFDSAWKQISANFDLLFTTEESIDQLKQTILQLAVMGKLVPQDPNDSPASEILKNIEVQKKKLIFEGKIKKENPLPPIMEQEKPFSLQKKWTFAYLQDLCLLITDGTHQTPQYVAEGRPFVSAQCVKPFRFIPANCTFVSEQDYQGYIKNRKPERGDILLSRVGAGIGEAAVIDTDLEFAIYVSTGLLKMPRESISSEYIVMWLNSPMGRSNSERDTLGKGTSQGNLNLSLIRRFLISLPPYQEQLRIVAKVNELMSICDRLRGQISFAKSTAINFADAITSKTIFQETTPMPECAQIASNL